jgi:hypothetical protein
MARIVLITRLHDGHLSGRPRAERCAVWVPTRVLDGGTAHAARPPLNPIHACRRFASALSNCAKRRILARTRSVLAGVRRISTSAVEKAAGVWRIYRTGVKIRLAPAGFPTAGDSPNSRSWKSARSYQRPGRQSPDSDAGSPFDVHAGLSPDACPNTGAGRYQGGQQKESRTGVEAARDRTRRARVYTRLYWHSLPSASLPAPTGTGRGMSDGPGWAGSKAVETTASRVGRTTDQDV